MVLAGLEASCVFDLEKTIDALLFGNHFPDQFCQRNKVDLFAVILVQSKNQEPKSVAQFELILRVIAKNGEGKIVVCADPNRISDKVFFKRLQIVSQRGH
ncbi:conserved hypothetical protein [delta proteobacterium NaphS2]|nr:conserved hypothetical protein [delta proteobacterium NaphS2]